MTTLTVDDLEQDQQEIIEKTDLSLVAIETLEKDL